MDTVWLAIGIQTIAMLTVLISGYTRLIVRLSIIEAQLSAERERRVEKATARMNDMKVFMDQHCREMRKECRAYQDYSTGVITMPGVST